MGRNIKIILVGSRWTGKGQIGRAWEKTDADLPSLQPVILYERTVDIEKYPDKQIRVVAWVLSYDSEFEDLRSSFYKNPEPDGIILTFDLANTTGNTLAEMKNFRNEIKKKLGFLPPQVLMGVLLSSQKEIMEDVRTKAKNWAKNNGQIPYFESIYSDTEYFSHNVDKAFSTLLSLIKL